MKSVFLGLVLCAGVWTCVSGVRGIYDTNHPKGAVLTHVTACGGRASIGYILRLADGTGGTFGPALEPAVTEAVSVLRTSGSLTDRTLDIGDAQVCPK